MAIPIGRQDVTRPEPSNGLSSYLSTTIFEKSHKKSNPPRFFLISPGLPAGEPPTYNMMKR